MSDPLSPLFLQPDEAAEYFFEEGCYILELLNSAVDPALSIARARVPAGGRTRWHRLRGISERYLILQGQGQAEIGDAVELLVPGAVVLIPPGCRQRIVNEGAQDLIFLALCTPRFQVQAYEALDADARD